MNTNIKKKYGINCLLISNENFEFLIHFPFFQTFPPFLINYFYLETLYHFSWSSFFLKFSEKWHLCTSSFPVLAHDASELWSTGRTFAKTNFKLTITCPGLLGKCFMKHPTKQLILTLASFPCWSSSGAQRTRHLPMIVDNTWKDSWIYADECFETESFQFTSLCENMEAAHFQFIVL